MTRHPTTATKRKRDGYVALCPELDVASRGDSAEKAKRNLTEALGFFGTADPREVNARLRSEVYVTRLEVDVGVRHPKCST